MARATAYLRSRGIPAGALLPSLLAWGLLSTAMTPPRARAQGSTLLQAALSLPSAPDSRVINLTPHPGFFNEPSIAINPRNPLQIVAAYQVPATAAYSGDAGIHWSLAAAPAPKNYRVSGDVSLAFDDQGHAFLCYIAFDKLGTENYWAHNATRNGIFVRRSLDGGHTWQKNPVPVIVHPSKPGIPFEDKPSIVADQNPQSPYAGYLYVGWTQFTLSKSVILFSRSTDVGRMWSAPVEISTQEGLPRDDNGDVEGFTGAVAPDGTLYAVWAVGNRIAFTDSRDGGKTFAPSREIIHTAPPYFKVSDLERANGFPQLAIDPRTERLFVCWSDYRNGGVDVFVATSADRGSTWSPAVRVNSDPLHDGRDHFFPWLAVDRASGDAYVVFYDRRDAARNRKPIVVLARSTDGGRSFLNYAWTRKPFDPRGDFLGDYTGLAAYGGRVYGVWTEEVAGAKPTGRRKGRSPASSTAIALSRAKFRSATHHTIVRVGRANFGLAD